MDLGVLLFLALCGATCILPMAVVGLGIVYVLSRKPKAVQPTVQTPKNEEKKMIKKDVQLMVGGDQNWFVKLTGMDLDANTVDDVEVARLDGTYFRMFFTRALGYLFPMFQEILDKSGRAGSILLKVRTSPDGAVHLVVERCKWVNHLNQREDGWRIPRTSIHNVDGQHLLEIAGMPLEHFTIVLTNNARITGPVACAAVVESWDSPITDKEKLITLMEADDLNDCPGLAVLAKWLIKHPQK